MRILNSTTRTHYSQTAIQREGNWEDPVSKAIGSVIGELGKFFREDKIQAGRTERTKIHNDTVRSSFDYQDRQNVRDNDFRNGRVASRERSAGKAIGCAGLVSLATVTGFVVKSCAPSMEKLIDRGTFDKAPAQLEKSYNPQVLKKELRAQAFEDYRQRLKDIAHNSPSKAEQTQALKTLSNTNLNKFTQKLDENIKVLDPQPFSLTSVKESALNILNTL